MAKTVDGKKRKKCEGLKESLHSKLERLKQRPWGGGGNKGG